MRILYVGMRYDYGIPARGFSFEHCNLYDTLIHLGHEVFYFDFMTLLQTHGRRRMNQRLFEAVQEVKPDLLFCVLFTEEIDRQTMRRISKQGDVVTLNWFCDDHWRFDNYSRHWAPCFNWVVTTTASAVPKYERIGYTNAIKSQWGCNHFSYRRLNLPMKYDVTFVGQPHGTRREVIQALSNAGIRVETWGVGWENGRLAQEEMIRAFNQSRINLNLSNASIIHRRHRFKIWKNWGRWQQPVDQIKGRNFEIPGCSGFLLTGYAEDLESYYVPGKEVVCFADTGDLIDKARYYLSHEEERAAIARAGYDRTLRDHTYESRFHEIFQRAGLLDGANTQGKSCARTWEITAASVVASQAPSTIDH